MKTRQLKEYSQMLASSKGQISSLPCTTLSAPEFVWWTWLTLSFTRTNKSGVSPRPSKWSTGLINGTLISGPVTIGGSTIGCGLGPIPFRRHTSPSSSMRVVPSSPQKSLSLASKLSSSSVNRNRESCSSWFLSTALRVYAYTQTEIGMPFASQSLGRKPPPSGWS